MKKTKLKAVALIAVLVMSVGGAALYTSEHSNKKVDNKPLTSQQSNPADAKLTVSEDKKTVSYEGQTGKTALEILKSLTNVTTKQSSYGEFVTGIGGVQADGTKQFWSFYINGKLADVGAGTYKTTNGEKIEWRIEDVQ